MICKTKLVCTIPYFDAVTVACLACSTHYRRGATNDGRQVLTTSPLDNLAVSAQGFRRGANKVRKVGALLHDASTFWTLIRFPPRSQNMWYV